MRLSRGEFTMRNQDRRVLCAVSTAAMDDLERRNDVQPHERVDQFMRLRDAIEERASRKFFEGPVEAQAPVLLSVCAHRSSEWRRTSPIRCVE
jgi:hypothetical protein